MFVLAQSRQSDKFRCCCNPCQGISFLTSKYGMLKIVQIILTIVALTFVYDVQKSPDEPPLPNRVFFSFATSLNMAIFQTINFTIVYMISERSFHLVRSSLFEIAINTLILAALIYSTMLVAFKKNFFTNPLTFLEGRSNDTSETVLYYLGSFLILCYTSDIILAVFAYFKLSRRREQKQISIFKL